MSDDRIHAEALPGGGVRIQGAGIDLKVTREAIERSEDEGGLGFNYAMTPELHGTLDPTGSDSPIDAIHNFAVQLQPRDTNPDG